MSLHTLILAAGSSSRFGHTPKQLALIDGLTLLERSINLAQEISETTVILGCESERLKNYVNNTRVLVNPYWQEGLGNSIAYGVASLPTHVSAVLILLCDQVAITLADLKKLHHRYNELRNEVSLPIVCASYANGLGVPAIFPQQFFPQLIALKGDVGAKKLLQGNSVVSVPMEHAAIDIDTQENWIQFTQCH